MSLRCISFRNLKLCISTVLGVPQRRSRIAVVMDSAKLSAREVLFESQGLRWNPEPGKATGKESATAISDCTDPIVCTSVMSLTEQLIAARKTEQ